MQLSLCVLGCLNDKDGTLSAVSCSRIELAAKIYHDIFRSGQKCVILATGGFGKHFNESPAPHNQYAKKYLLELGVRDSDVVVEGLESGNTVEDAIFCNKYLDNNATSSTTVITSNYHLPRAAIIFNAILKGKDINFQSVRDCENTPEYLFKHEPVAIADLIGRGFIYYGSDKFYI